MIGDWKVGELLIIEVEGFDIIVVCLFLLVDVFVEFEDVVSFFWIRYYNFVIDFCYLDLDGWRWKIFGMRIYWNIYEN